MQYLNGRGEEPTGSPPTGRFRIKDDERPGRHSVLGRGPIRHQKKFEGNWDQSPPYRQFHSDRRPRQPRRQLPRNPVAFVFDRELLTGSHILWEVQQEQ